MKLLICMPVFNRKKITELSLKNLQKYKRDSTLWVFNDWSTEYDNDFIEPYCDKVFKLDVSKLPVVGNEANLKGMGVQHLRWYQLRLFLKTDYDALYFTDNDAIHDPDFLDVINDMPKENPISLYNSCLYGRDYTGPTKHLDKKLSLEEVTGFYATRYAGGISHFYTREMVEVVVRILDSRPKDPDYSWDYEMLDMLNKKICITKTSYVEHFGAGGLHSGHEDFTHDRAIAPTGYLQNIRQPIVDYLLGHGPRPEI